MGKLQGGEVMKEYRKKETVKAEKYSGAPIECNTSWGKQICYNGDYLVYSNNECYPVKADVFEKTYEPINKSKTSVNENGLGVANGSITIKNNAELENKVNFGNTKFVIDNEEYTFREVLNIIAGKIAEEILEK